MIADDSASLVERGDADAIIITGSPGGVLAGRPGYGIAAQAGGVVGNDAGVDSQTAPIRKGDRPA